MGSENRFWLFIVKFKIPIITALVIIVTLSVTLPLTLSKSSPHSSDGVIKHPEPSERAENGSSESVEKTLESNESFINASVPSSSIENSLESGESIKRVVPKKLQSVPISTDKDNDHDVKGDQPDKTCSIFISHDQDDEASLDQCGNLLLLDCQHPHLHYKDSGLKLLDDDKHKDLEKFECPNCRGGKCHGQIDLEQHADYEQQEMDLYEYDDYDVEYDDYKEYFDPLTAFIFDDYRDENGDDYDSTNWNQNQNQDSQFITINGITTFKSGGDHNSPKGNQNRKEDSEFKTVNGITSFK